MEYEKLMEKAKGAKSAEELLALAKENDIEMTEEEAEETFAMLGKSGELSDEELSNVSGGGCHVDVGGKSFVVVTSALNCMNGRYESNWTTKTSYMGIKTDELVYAKDSFTLRKTWFGVSKDGQCGRCRWLCFKGGTGYCRLTAE